MSNPSPGRGKVASKEYEYTGEDGRQHHVYEERRTRYIDDGGPDYLVERTTTRRHSISQKSGLDGIAASSSVASSSAARNAFDKYSRTTPRDYGAASDRPTRRKSTGSDRTLRPLTSVRSNGGGGASGPSERRDSVAERGSVRSGSKQSAEGSPTQRRSRSGSLDDGRIRGSAASKFKEGGSSGRSLREVKEEAGEVEVLETAVGRSRASSPVRSPESVLAAPALGSKWYSPVNDYRERRARDRERYERQIGRNGR